MKDTIPNVFAAGTDMTCCVCGATAVANDLQKSDWRCIEVDKVRHYACPKEFPPDGATSGQYGLAYERVIKIILEKFPAKESKVAKDGKLNPEDFKALEKPQKCRKCGCTGARACSDNGVGCHWVLPDLCSACVPKELNERDVRKLQQVRFGLELTGPEALSLLAALQLAMRHPGFPDGLSRAVCIGVAQVVQEQVSVTENLTAIAAAGWTVNMESVIAPA